MQRTVSIVNTERYIKSLRHCKSQLFYLRQITKENEIEVEFITNEDMVAEGGTKSLDGTEIERIRVTEYCLRNRLKIYCLIFDSL